MTPLTTERMIVHGIAREFHDYEFRNFPGDPEARELVEGYTSALTAHRNAGQGLFLYGPNGTGKTSLGVCVLKAALRQGMTAHLYSWPLLLEDRPKTWRDPVFARDFSYCVFESDFLMLDDLGKEMKPDGDLAVSTLDMVLRRRSSTLRPTIITTNAETASLRSTYGDSIASLMNKHVIPILVKGDDMRANVP